MNYNVKGVFASAKHYMENDSCSPDVTLLIFLLSVDNFGRQVESVVEASIAAQSKHFSAQYIIKLI